MSSPQPEPNFYELDRQAASWEALSNTRERLARIETKLDSFISAQAAMDTRIATVAERITSFNITPAQFVSWKICVDEVVTAFKNNLLVVATQQAMRAKDWARLAGALTVGGTIAGLVARFAFA